MGEIEHWLEKKYPCIIVPDKGDKIKTLEGKIKTVQGATIKHVNKRIIPYIMYDNKWIPYRGKIVELNKNAKKEKLQYL